MSFVFSYSHRDGAIHIKVPDSGMPEILAWAPSRLDAASISDRASRINGMDDPPPSAVILPTGGAGFFGWPAIQGHRDGQDFTLLFANWRHEERDGALMLRAHDAVARVSVALRIAIHDGDVLTFATTLTNEGDTPYMLERCMARSMVAPAGPATLTTFTGMWGREFQQRETACPDRLTVQESRRGRTSHDRFPALVFKQGAKQIAMHLGFSGNHVIAMDPLDDGRRLIHAGELFEPGEMRLQPNESYESPPLFFARDPAALRNHVRKKILAWPNGSMRPRPVTLNSWEGNYFDHKIEALKAQIDEATSLGIERFVLDDGWFGKRNDDTSSLGDWDIDPAKYPDGFKPLVDHTLACGLEFGIWIEPEMVNPDSDLFRAHPDWALQIAGRPLLTSRNQLVLDLTRPDVFDYLFSKFDQLLRANAISYLKWDMNRDLTFAGDHSGRAATSRQTRAFYRLMEKLRSAHPDVEVESCASGGGRADYGVLKYTHRIWTSDCTDPLERLSIQDGARIFLPPEILGSHISASPNHQTHRVTTLDFRALVAFAYHFGVELDPTKLDADAKAKLRDWIALHKELRPHLHDADAQFALAPLDGRYVWGAITDKRAVVIIAQGAQMQSEHPAPLTLPMRGSHLKRWRVTKCHPVEPDFIRINESQKKFLKGEGDASAFDLAEIGINLPMLRPESGVVLIFDAEDREARHG
ncbi:MAG: alpha-galactosidase [Alphaproteobacteria bacterium]